MAFECHFSINVVHQSVVMPPYRGGRERDRSPRRVGRVYEAVASWPPGRADGSKSSGSKSGKKDGKKGGDDGNGGKGGKGGKKGKDGKDERPRYFVRAFVRWDRDKAVDIEVGELGITIYALKLWLALEYNIVNREDMVIWVPEIEHVGVLRQRAAADRENIAPGGQVIANMPDLYLRWNNEIERQFGHPPPRSVGDSDYYEVITPLPYDKLIPLLMLQGFDGCCRIDLDQQA